MYTLHATVLSFVNLFICFVLPSSGTICSTKDECKWLGPLPPSHIACYVLVPFTKVYRNLLL